MSSRIAKQFGYGILFLAILALVALGIYFLFKPVASCFDNKQNQNEEGVDCGGPCKKVCLPQGLQPIELVQEVKIFYPASGHISLLAKIQNLNAVVAAKYFDYRFNVYDNENNLLRTVSGQSFIYSSEIKYLAEFLEDGSLKNVSRAEFLIENPDWARSEEFQKPSVSVLNQRVEVYKGELRVSGKIINNDTVHLPKAIIMAVFSDKFGATHGVSKTEIENLLVGESRSFAIAHPGIPSVEFPKAEILVFSRRP